MCGHGSAHPVWLAVVLPFFASYTLGETMPPEKVFCASGTKSIRYRRAGWLKPRTQLAAFGESTSLDGVWVLLGGGNDQKRMFYPVLSRPNQGVSFYICPGGISCRAPPIGRRLRPWFACSCTLFWPATGALRPAAGPCNSACRPTNKVSALLHKFCYKPLVRISLNQLPHLPPNRQRYITRRLYSGRV